jgi:predicted nucleotide-binding protein
MENFSGRWVGELNGLTNQGQMFLALQHEGDRIYGRGNFSEPSMGTYEYHVQGVYQNSSVRLILTPASQSNGGFFLGNVEANGKLNDQGKLEGKWRSSIGTAGQFNICREEAEAPPKDEQDESKKSVFIVHGQDDATKEKVARFIEKIGLNAIILHEQVSKSMTIIEKFEEYSKKSKFAVVLFTPDDVAYPLGKEEAKQPRARQNVILEMGYFVGLLSRDRVCVLYTGDVELPSDILGVVYNRIEDSEAWKLTLAKELKTAGYSIDLNSLIT